MTAIGALLQPLTNRHPTATMRVVSSAQASVEFVNPDFTPHWDSKIAYFGFGTRPLVGGQGVAQKVASNPDYQPIQPSVMVSAPKIALALEVLPSGQNSTDALVFVDGYFVGQAVLGSNSGQLLIIEGLENRVHHVSALLGRDALFAGIVRETGRMIYPGVPSRVRLAVLMDSFADVGQPPYRTGAVGALRRLTGFDIGAFAQSSTGVLANGGVTGKSPFGSTDRLNALQAFNPHIVVTVIPSGNDLGSTPAQVQTAANDLLQSLEARLPHAKVIMLTPQPVDTDYTPPHSAVQPYIAVTLGLASTHANVAGVVDWHTEDWLTGTGSTWNIRGDGNQDFFIGYGPTGDIIHPNRDGIDYLWTRFVEAIRPFEI